MKKQHQIMEPTLANLTQVTFTETLSNPVLTAKCSKLWHKKLENFTDEYLRIMIGQNLGLKYLIPIALERLLSAPLRSGNYREGALFCNVVMARNYWEHNASDLIILKEVRAKVPGMHNYVDKDVVKTMNELCS